MENLEDLKRRIHTAVDLHSLVRTMKALAAVNIRQLESAVESLAEYKRTVEMGLRTVLRTSDRMRIVSRSAPRSSPGVVVFGSDQGMCGQLNDLVASFTHQQLFGDKTERGIAGLIAVGSRVASRLENIGLKPDSTVSVAHSTAGIIPLVQDLLLMIDAWNRKQRIGKVVVIFCEHTSRASWQAKRLDLLPIDRRWLDTVCQQPWATNQLATFSMDIDELFSSLVQQYLFVSLYRSCAESMASENASRLAAMRGAERNIGERIENLNREFNQIRQMSITEELLDIASGFEAIQSADAN